MEKSDPDPTAFRISNADMVEAEDFVFTMGVGRGMHGLDVFGVNASGNAFYVFLTNLEDWWKAELTVPAATLAKLRRLLVEVDYAGLERGYQAAVCDGTQWCIQVEAGGITKKVYCNNFFPDVAEKLALEISRKILPAQEKEIF